MVLGVHPSVPWGYNYSTPSESFMLDRIIANYSETTSKINIEEPFKMVVKVNVDANKHQVLTLKY